MASHAPSAARSVVCRPMPADAAPCDHFGETRVKDVLFAGTLAFVMVIALSARANLIAFDGSAMIDPDSWMRLNRLRAVIETGQLVHTVAGADAGQPLSLHWTHLLEGVMLPFVRLLSPMLGLDGALTAVGVMVGPLSEMVLAMALCWAVAPLVPTRHSRTPVGGLVAVTPMLLSYGLFGVADHHVLLVALVALACGCAWRAALRPALLPAAALGFWAAVGAWLSVESLTYSAMAYGGLGIGWLTAGTPAERRRIARLLLVAGGTLTITMMGAILVDPPTDGILGVEMDRLSVPFVMAALVITTAAASMLITAEWRLPLRLTATMLVLGFTGVTWILGFVDALRVPAEVMLTSGAAGEEAGFDWNRISEMKPIGDAYDFVIHCGLGTMGLLAGACALRRRVSGVAMVYGLACGGCGLLVGAVHIRFSIYAAAMGIAGIVLGLEWLRCHTALAGGFRTAAMMTLALAALSISMGAAAARPPDTDHTPLKPCPMRDVEATLRGLTGEMLLVFPNDAPELLFRARSVRVVGALYHRGHRGLNLFNRTWDAPADQARTVMRQRDIHWVLFCLPQAPIGEVSGAESTGASISFGNLMTRGTPPDWLRPAQPAVPGVYTLFEVQ
ncbi:hypothetical protein [Azospirillum picis]|uniref:Glycosyltransferase RgtA/B/C/D-like domain-containing protein n=1 Tax=Azospirillum picis TaxID=488438 RepID=A0ABU0MNM8_9PROT|nr:hypothetical protein [Azospirillum picis]MBP2301104.1 hypothetical protein [Azospirillum picis]MDQ0534934.1 hypothetical protein [Azospirillum picis]